MTGRTGAEDRPPVRHLETLPRKLRERRLARDLSQRALSVKSGVSIPTIMRYEQGAGMPTMPTLKKLAPVLGMSDEECVELFMESQS